MGVGMPSLLRRRTSDETSVLTAEVTGMHCLYAPEMRLEQELCLADLWKRRTGAAALVLAGAQILLKSLTLLVLVGTYNRCILILIVVRLANLELMKKDERWERRQGSIGAPISEGDETHITLRKTECVYLPGNQPKG